VGGDEGKDIRRETIDVNEGVPPLADVRQRGRDVPVELRNVVEGEAVEDVSVSLLKILRANSQGYFATYDGE